MSAPAAISAQLVDVRNLDTHKCVKMTIHVPAEQAPAVLAAFGWPTMVDPVPVAIARLDINAMKRPLPHPKERREFYTLPFPQQAGIRSDDLKFALWMSHLPVGKECETAAEAIRAYCGVESRAHILPGTKAGDRWIELLRSYEERR